MSVIANLMRFSYLILHFHKQPYSITSLSVCSCMRSHRRMVNHKWARALFSFVAVACSAAQSALPHHSNFIAACFFIRYILESAYIFPSMFFLYKILTQCKREIEVTQFLAKKVNPKMTHSESFDPLHNNKMYLLNSVTHLL